MPDSLIGRVVERYRSDVHWTPDGMTYPHLNCWGLVRHARAELYGLPMLPAFDIPSTDVRQVTRAAEHVIDSCLVELGAAALPEAGDVAAVWRGRLCVHVALVIQLDGRRAALEASEHGVRWRWLPDWVRRQTGVSYYRDHPRLSLNAAG